ncbi:hypothetical protein [uncultured Fibrobacter sp.]|uniref:hypothetical protein n=1 Tax=uncultured Fibrobacter sp. TaxID=261512 RepID=UPI0025E45B4D|nr:hypothetical protein [uncultured Fibrobacter sp.]
MPIREKGGRRISKTKNMDDNYLNVVGVLAEISSVLSELSGSEIELSFTGASAPCEGKISYEIEDVDIPCDLIHEPDPKCPQDKPGYYTVNRIRLKDIIDDYANGNLFSKEEIQGVIKGIGAWGYC